MRVVIADDSVLLREGLARLLAEAGFEACALAGDAGALEAAVAEHRPDLALVDIRMPPTYTHEGAARRRRAPPEPGPSWASCCCRSRWRASTPPSWPGSTRSGSATC